MAATGSPKRLNACLLFLPVRGGWSAGAAGEGWWRGVLEEPSLSGQVGIVKIVERERRRLRRKYLKLTAHRRFSAYRLDHWLDREHAKTALPLMPAILASAMMENRTLIISLWVAGLAVATPWFLFVSWQVLAVAARMGDKRYKLVTRKHLAREYREDGPKPPRYPPAPYDDLT
jgi:hypothetical protein